MTELNDLSLKEEFKSEKHQFLFENLSKNLKRIEKKDYVVVSKKTRLNLDEFNCNILFWEDFTDYHYWWSMCSAKTQIFNLFEILNKKEAPITFTIHIIPFCLEDEGVLYYKSIKTLNYNTMTYLPNVYDFIDLKEVNSHLKQH